jgi:4-hydroxy-L-threonine phosphate dehydrogenase PdxA
MPLLAVTMGDPAGIGPEVILKAASVRDVRAETGLVVYGDPLVLERAASDGGIQMRVVVVGEPEEARERRSPGEVCVIAVSKIDASSFGWGAPSPATDRAQVTYIERAFRDVAANRADAMVTAPISKAALSRAGAPWPGHTEMLAELAGIKGAVMMLAGPTLKVVPLTVHIALKDVAAHLSVEKIADRGRRPQSARGRARPLRQRGARADRARDRARTRGKDRYLGPASR